MPENDNQPFPRLPGIDTDAGLKVVRNNSQLYKRLLLKFADSYGAFEQQFRDAQKGLADDPEGPRRSAHTLKGVAGNLGMNELSESAYQLQLACESDSIETDSRLAEVLRQLSVITDGLARLAD